MDKRERVMNGLECCTHGVNKCAICPYDPRYNKIDEMNARSCMTQLAMDALELLKAQEARIMTLDEVEALPYGHMLIETDKDEPIRWVDALLFCKNTNFSFDFITLEGRARLFGTEYNREWRCWTSRPTEEQRKAVKWDE